MGDLHVFLWSDEVVHRLTGRPPKFPAAERRYLIEAIRYVAHTTLVTELDSADALPADAASLLAAGGIWAVDEADDTPAKRAACAARGIGYRVFTAGDLTGFPTDDVPETALGHPAVIVTGCYDWLHSGHVRFFEEASAYGDLIVVAGNDANVRHLKGEGHPLQTQDERRYMVAAIRYVKLALISSGWGWLDAEPEIHRLKPDIYLVNEDGDRPEKRAFCAAHGLRYVVLKRAPKEGLPRRSSTDLRGY
ncbi:MAG: adenylyltransferase/cytidyltransferase family protein [Anaerolineae bacterium]|nr:adenylyltransferase/cytidyltransferase family protein [Anaerolineae bacterium]